MYLDDLIVLALECDAVQHHFSTAHTLFVRLGLPVATEKTQTPSKVVNYDKYRRHDIVYAHR